MNLTDVSCAQFSTCEHSHRQNVGFVLVEKVGSGQSKTSTVQQAGGGTHT